MTFCSPFSLSNELLEQKGLYRHRDEGPACKLTVAYLDDHDQPHLLAADAEPLDVAFFSAPSACGYMFRKIHPASDGVARLRG